MGGDEVVPFSDRSVAEKFVADKGGRIVTFDQVPRDYVLASGGDDADAAPSDDADQRHRP
jgi:copper chaperone NosL